MGWGGVGMMTFLAHEHIFHATEMMSFLAHEHIFDATENWGGVGMMTFLAHEHIFDATEMMSFLAETTFERSQSFDQSFHTHMQILERSFECTACENFAGACKQKRQFGETIQTQVFRGRW